MARAGRGSIRIIGGRWRGTRITVGDALALRPSSDRVRETLFNWLTPHLPGARCLDLFAGTGVLGFEAVSRGAASCDLIEHDRVLAQALETLKQRLQAEAIDIHCADAVQWLRRPPTPYDIVFVDPPFHSDIAAQVLERLACGWLSSSGLLYLETERDADRAADGWEVMKHGRTRHVSYALLRHTG